MTHHDGTVASFMFSSLQSLSCVRLFVIPRTVTRQASLSITFMLEALFRTKSIKVGFTKTDHLAPYVI